MPETSEGAIFPDIIPRRPWRPTGGASAPPPLPGGEGGNAVPTAVFEDYLPAALAMLLRRHTVSRSAGAFSAPEPIPNLAADQHPGMHGIYPSWLERRLPRPDLYPSTMMRPAIGVTAWTEPAVSPTTSGWTEPAATPVTTTWTEPAITPTRDGVI